MWNEARRVLVVAGGVGLLAAGIAGGQAPQLLPVDEAVSRPDFFSFRAQLQRAVARHDVDAVLAVVHPDIKNTFGGDDGIAAFRERWRLGHADSDLWETLGAVLALGGSFLDRDTFAAPYTFSRWPDVFDAYEHVVLVASDVRIRARPDLDAAVAATMSFAILPSRRRESVASGTWWVVRLGDGRVGYVAAHLARSPIDHRAFFAHRDGRWQMVMFIAGD